MVAAEKDLLRLIKSGVSDKMIQLARHSVEPGTAKSNFSELDDQVVVWANVKRMAPVDSQVVFSWYSPDGALYAKTDPPLVVAGNLGPNIYIHSSHKIRDTSMARKLGRWKVDIFSGPSLIDTVYFHVIQTTAGPTGIGSSGQGETTPTQTPVASGKFCGECGARIDNEEKFCGNCGAPTTPIRREESSAVTSYAAEETLLGGFASADMMRNRAGIGYGVYVTNRRIIGTKKPMLTRGVAGGIAGAAIGGLIGGRIGAQVGSRVLGSKMSTEGNRDLIADLDKNKDFEAYREDITLVQLKSPGLTSPGQLAIFLRGEKTTNIAVGLRGENVYVKLKELFQTYYPQVLRTI